MSLDMDRVFSEIGEFGSGQRRYFLVMCLFNCYAAFHMLLYAFTGYIISFQCQAGDQDTPHYNSCPFGLSSKCQDVSFNSGNIEEWTLVSEWNLICDRGWLAPVTMSAFMAGVMCGAVVMGAAADKYGRHRVLFLCLFHMIAFNALSGFVDSFSVYILLRFMVGIMQSGFILATFVLLNEVIGSSWRGMLGTALQGAFAIGIILYSVLGYNIRHWRALTYVVSLVGIPLLLFFFYLPEREVESYLYLFALSTVIFYSVYSPRWLQGQGRPREALLVLKKIAAKNGKKLGDQVIANGSKEDEHIATSGEAGKEGVTQLFSHRTLFQVTAIQLLSWFANSFCYYGLTLAAATNGNDDGDGSNRYMTTALSGAVELPAYALTMSLLPLLGRRITLGGYMVVGGVALILIPLMGALFAWYIWSAAMLAKFSIAASFAVIYVHSGEIFPTCIRNSAMGLVSFAARLGGMLAPQGVALGQIMPDLHLLVFGVSMIVSGLLNLKLPETANKPLPDTIGDMLKASQEPQYSVLSSSRGAVSVTPKATTKANKDGYTLLSVEESDEDRYEDDFEPELRPR